jgi:6-pyruvoyl-tetrahydropterin synthase
MSQKKKPDSYYFGKFLNVLREKEAEVRIYGRTYSSKEKNLTIKNLVGEICELSENKLNTLLRKGELAKENTRKGKISQKQKDVINQLDYHFLDDSPGSKKNHFYMYGEFQFTEIYPELLERVIDSVITMIRNRSIEDIYKYFFLKHYNSQFSTITDRLYEGKFIDKEDSIKIRKIQSPTNFEEVAKRYISKSRKILKANKADNLVLAYSGSAGSVYKRKKLFERLNTDFEDTFSNPTTWFDQFRYRRLELMSAKLYKMDINKCPKWTIEHFILAQLEHIILREQINAIVLAELTENIQFILYTSTDGRTIDMQDDSIDNFKKLANTLAQYRFPGSIENYVKIKGGNILDGEYFKMPNYFVTKNQESPLDYALAISEPLMSSFCTTICNKIGFGESISHEMKENIHCMFCDYLKYELKI